MSTNTVSSGAALPTDILEMRAAEQRRRIHDSVVELRQQVQEKLDVRKKAREYVAPAAGVAALLGLVLGYGITGFFTDRPRNRAPRWVLVEEVE